MQQQPWDDLQPYLRLITAKRVYWLILIVIAIAAAATSFYTVEANEEGVVLRFGEYVRSVPPGAALQGARLELKKQPVSGCGKF